MRHQLRRRGLWYLHALNILSLISPPQQGTCHLPWHRRGPTFFCQLPVVSNETISAFLQSRIAETRTQGKLLKDMKFQSLAVQLITASHLNISIHVSPLNNAIPNSSHLFSPFWVRGTVLSIFQTFLHLILTAILESCKVGAIISPIIQVQKLRHRRGQITCPAEVQRAWTWTWTVSRHSPYPEPKSLMALLDVGSQIYGWLAFDKLRVNGSIWGYRFQRLFLKSTLYTILCISPRKLVRPSPQSSTVPLLTRFQASCLAYLKEHPCADCRAGPLNPLDPITLMTIPYIKLASIPLCPPLHFMALIPSWHVFIDLLIHSLSHPPGRLTPHERGFVLLTVFQSLEQCVAHSRCLINVEIGEWTVLDLLPSFTDEDTKVQRG